MLRSYVVIMVWADQMAPAQLRHIRDSVEDDHVGLFLVNGPHNKADKWRM